MTLFYLVCFDIVDDRTRTRAARLLKEYGVRVQKSVFECSLLSEKRFLKMRNRLEGMINSTEDTLRYYFVCKECLGKMEYSGIGKAPDIKDYRIV